MSCIAPIYKELAMSKILNLSLMTQKQIVDKTTNKISEFIVIDNPKMLLKEWIIKYKYLDMISILSSEPIDYRLKETSKGNPDEGKAPQDGKALRLSVSDDSVTIVVYVQAYGKPWTESHTHILDKALFDAYRLVIKNEADIAEKEKEKKSPANFSLNLE